MKSTAYELKEFTSLKKAIFKKWPKTNKKHEIVLPFSIMIVVNAATNR